MLLEPLLHFSTSRPPAVPLSSSCPFLPSSGAQPRVPARLLACSVELPYFIRATIPAKQQLFGPPGFSGRLDCLTARADLYVLTSDHLPYLAALITAPAHYQSRRCGRTCREWPAAPIKYGPVPLCPPLAICDPTAIHKPRILISAWRPSTSAPSMAPSRPRVRQAAGATNSTSRTW